MSIHPPHDSHSQSKSPTPDSSRRGEPATSSFLQPRDMKNKQADDSDTGSVATQVLAEPLPVSMADAFRSTTAGMKDIFLDYDGTLREFEVSPELAVPSEELCLILKALNERDDLRVAFVSGRPKEFLTQHFSNLDRFTLIAEHGQHILRRYGKYRNAPTTSWEHFLHCHDDPEAWKKIMRVCMNRAVERSPGSFVEEKANSLVWHYRRCDTIEENNILENLTSFENCLKEQKLDGQLRVQRGNKILEVVSGAQVRKGNAVRKLQTEWSTDQPSNGVAPATLCAGDDVSDEDMFGSAIDAVTIKVGAGTTSARFFVDTPADFRHFLSQIV